MNLSYFLTVIVLALSAICAQAQTTTINTVPEGVTTYTIPATSSTQSPTLYFSAPLSNDPVYTGAVFSVGSATITISDSPWSTNQFSPGTTPYFVKFLSGLQEGRVILVQLNSANTLTLDTTDHSSQTVPLTTSGFSVAAGDSFEIFAGDTLGLTFGLNTTPSPLILKGGTSLAIADTVSIYNTSTVRFVSYYFDTSAGFWKASGSTVNANNTIIYPYSAFSITRRPSQPALTFTLMGRVAEVNRLIKTTGSSRIIYDSIGYPVDMKLSSLNLGNWTKNSSFGAADSLSVWNSATTKFDAYYELPDSTWRRSDDAVTDRSNFVIPAGTTVAFVKRAAGLSGSTSYLQTMMPYTTN